MVGPLSAVVKGLEARRPCHRLHDANEPQTARWRYWSARSTEDSRMQRARSRSTKPSSGMTTTTPPSGRPFEPDACPHPRQCRRITGSGGLGEHPAFASAQSCSCAACVPKPRRSGNTVRISERTSPAPIDSSRRRLGLVRPGRHHRHLIACFQRLLIALPAAVRRRGERRRPPRTDRP